MARGTSAQVEPGSHGDVDGARHQSMEATVDDSSDRAASVTTGNSTREW